MCLYFIQQQHQKKGKNISKDDLQCYAVKCIQGNKVTYKESSMYKKFSA